jgi:hypothetical protein
MANHRPVSTTAQDATRRPVSRRLIIGLAILALLIGAGCFYLLTYGSRQTPEVPYTKIPDTVADVDQKKTEEKSTKCRADETLYENRDLGSSFCYPTIWGTTTLSDARLSASDNGKRWLLGFNAKPQAHVGLVSSDWKTEVGRGGNCADPQLDAPATSDFSTEWKTDGAGADTESASRGIIQGNSYAVYEDANTFFGGVCLKGYANPGVQTYKTVTVSFFREFGNGVLTPRMHMNNPLLLVPATARDRLNRVVMSIQRI